MGLVGCSGAYIGICYVVARNEGKGGAHTFGFSFPGRPQLSI
jgi:hypothetical protein